MEDVSTCPICFEVPEKEIYQCSGGHVICDSCISKVSTGLCPQCRLAFGSPKIRNRALEEILDKQLFECKFKDNGCPVFCKRVVITSHANSCPFNPDTVPFCEQMGHKDCKFRLGCVSRAEVISHFEKVHNCTTKHSPNFNTPLPVRGKLLMSYLNLEKNLEVSKTPRLVSIGPLSFSDSDSTPLFLCFFKLNYLTGFLSFFSVKIWESSSHPPTKNMAQFVLFKDSPSTSIQLQATGNPPSTIGNIAFPLGGIMKVGSFREAHYFSNASPINIPISLLLDSQFGSEDGDYLKVEIQESQFSTDTVDNEEPILINID